MDHERLNQDILNQMKMAREYHFLDMHVYTNALFSDHGVMLTKDIIYNHYSPGTVMEKDHHVHIFMWAVNIDMPNMIHMIRFISMCNNIVRRPVYIHIPKRMNNMLPGFNYTEDLDIILKGMEIGDGNHLRYKIIVEKNSNVTEFKYGDYIPIDGMRWGSTRFPNAKLLVSWDPHGYARPTFYNGKTESPVILDNKGTQLVDLPYKVGDTIYEVDLPKYGIITCKVLYVNAYNGPMAHVPGGPIVSDMNIGVEVIDGHGKGSEYAFDMEDIDKNIFRTREEAEVALRNKENCNES